MSDALRAQQQVDAFLRGFLRPLLEGGRVQPGRALGPARLEVAALSASSDAEVDHAVLAALHAAASEHVPTRAVRWPDRGALALALAAHDLALLSDPRLDRAFARGARATLAGFVRTLIERAGPAATRGDALLRHAIVGRVLRLERTDTTVRNWSYTHRFQGIPVPPRFTAWRALRRVETTHAQRTLAAALAELPPALGAPALLDALVAASPLTRALHAAPESFRVDEALAPTLLDAPLRGAIARALLDADPARAGECVGAALRAHAATLPDGAAPALVRAALLLTFEVQATSLLDRGAPLPLSTPRSVAAVAAFAALVGSADGAAFVGVTHLGAGDARVLREAAIDARHRVGESAFHAALALVRVAIPASTSSLLDLSLAPESTP